MIRITVDVCAPRNGNKPEKTISLARFYVSNLSGAVTVSDYEVEGVVDPDTMKERVFKFILHGHERSRGWIVLVRRVLEMVADRADPR